MEKRTLMNKGVFVTLLCFNILTCTVAQSVTDYGRADAIAKATPDPVEQSINTLTAYFMANLTSEKELIRAFYFWTANEIAYDAENMFTFRSSDDPSTVTDETLRTRKAVCQGYAEVFHALCERAGIESHIVLGYTKQNGVLANLNHAWVVARIDTNWYFFDPTWGSGYLLQGRFTRKFTNDYFMVRPIDLIRSHMPFDPLWQCLYYPFSPGNFIQGTLPQTVKQNWFYFPDSIAAYTHLTKPERQAASLRRIESNGVVNNSISEYRQYLRQSLEIERINRENELQGEQVKKFNQAVNNYNIAALLFNDYINYWNHQFEPLHPDREIKRMLDTCDFHLAKSMIILTEIDPRDQNLKENMELLAKPIQQIQKQVVEQKAFLREYFATPPASRSTLFRKYNWLGAPGR